MVSFQPGAQALSPEQKLRKALDDFKESSMLITILYFLCAHLLQHEFSLGSTLTMTGQGYEPQTWSTTELAEMLK